MARERESMLDGEYQQKSWMVPVVVWILTISFLLYNPKLDILEMYAVLWGIIVGGAFTVLSIVVPEQYVEATFLRATFWSSLLLAVVSALIYVFSSFCVYGCAA